MLEDCRSQRMVCCRTLLISDDVNSESRSYDRFRTRRLIARMTVMGAKRPEPDKARFAAGQRKGAAGRAVRLRLARLVQHNDLARRRQVAGIDRQ